MSSQICGASKSTRIARDYSYKIYGYVVQNYKIVL